MALEESIMYNYMVMSNMMGHYLLLNRVGNENLESMMSDGEYC